ncbi:hypothetical protein FKM82_002315 [Ascaphus truei]
MYAGSNSDYLLWPPFPFWQQISDFWDAAILGVIPEVSNSLLVTSPPTPHSGDQYCGDVRHSEQQFWFCPNREELLSHTPPQVCAAVGRRRNSYSN